MGCGFLAAEPPVPAFGHPVIDPVSQRPRDDMRDAYQRPGKGKVTQTQQAGRGLDEGPTLGNGHHVIEGVRRQAVLAKDGLALVRLDGCEAKDALGITLAEKGDPSGTEHALAVV